MSDPIKDFMDSIGRNGKNGDNLPERAEDTDPLSPEDLLSMTAEWMSSSKSLSDSELMAIEDAVKRHKVKQEVFHVARSNASARNYAKMYREYWGKLIPKVFNPAAMEEYTDGQRINLVKLGHEILTKEGQLGMTFLKDGPQELPPLVHSQSIYASDDVPITAARKKLEDIGGKGRDKVRALIDGLETMTKGILAGKDEE